MISLVTFLTGFLVSYFGTWGLLKVRLQRGFVDVPNERSSHEEPKPRFGGIAIICGIYVAYGVLLYAVPGSRSFLPFAAGALLLFGAGIVDDWRGLPAPVRFGIQVTSALLIVAFGGVVDHIRLPMAGEIGLGILSVPLTILFVLISINFYNFIDGIDGLAAGSAFISALFLSLIAYMLGHLPLALLSLAVAGAALGFLHFNFPPSKLFMGDGGSTFFGFFFAYFAITGNRLTPELPFFIPVLVLSSLYLDAGLTLIKRASRGEAIFDAHHTHYYQRLLSLGLNHKQVTVLEYALNVLLGISAVIYFKAGSYFLVFLSLCWVVIFTALILKIRGLERGDRLFWEKRTLFVVIVDLLLITLSYMGAYFLRLNFRFTQPEGIAMLKAYPIVLVVRSACFHWYGLYRGVWKYTSIEDLLKIIKAVTAGSAIILTSVVLLYRFVAFPRSLFVIEYFLLIMAIGGARFAFRIFHEFGKEAHGSCAKRVAIIGAGDFGERTAREIRNTEGGTTAIACFIDDDKSKIGLTLRGVPILGPVQRLKEICKAHSIDALVLAISALPDEKLQDIVRDSQDVGVPLEGRNGILARREEPMAVRFSRLARGYGRMERGFRQQRLRDFYDGKRVLVTGGAEPIARPAIRELLGYEAVVTVQVETALEASIYEGWPRERLSVFVGSPDRSADVSELLELAAPTVVFQCHSLRRSAALNGEAIFWRRVVRGTEVLMRDLKKLPVISYNVLAHWGEEPAGSSLSYASAVAEAIVLNAEQASGAAHTVIRFPRILTEEALRRIVDCAKGDPARDPTEGGAQQPEETFDILETEAIAGALEVAASYQSRALLVPRYRSPFSADAVRESLSRPGELGGGEARFPHPYQLRTALLFPAETVKPSKILGLWEVISPIFPASQLFLETVCCLCAASSGEVQREAIRALSAELREQVLSELHVPVK